MAEQQFVKITGPDGGVGTCPLEAVDYYTEKGFVVDEAEVEKARAVAAGEELEVEPVTADTVDEAPPAPPEPVEPRIDGDGVTIPGTFAGAAVPFNPDEHTVEQVQEYLDNLPDTEAGNAEAERVLAAERNGQGRKTLVG